MSFLRGMIRMTEKRFKLVDRNGIYQILDLHKKGRHILTGEENVELLNTLHEENEQLRRYVYHCPQICNKILAYLGKCEKEDVKAVNDAMDYDKYFDEEIDTLRSWE